MEALEIVRLIERFGVASPRTGGVLLVDDEELNVKVLRGFLEDGWTVHEATSGEQALEIAGRVPLDVVVTDQRMPGMSGVELLEVLRTRRPDVAGIVLTAFADLHALESAINRANVFRFLRKPWEPAEILRAVEQASEHVVQRRAIEQLVTMLAQRSDELRASLEELKAQQEMLLHLERLGTVGRLASGVTHDLKNVMVALRAAQFETTQHPVPPAVNEILTLGLSAVDNLLRTLQTLHEYARTGSLALQLQPVAPATIVQDAVAIARMDLNFKMRRVQCDVSPDLPPLSADRQKLTQVLVNLVRNALQATANGAAVRVTAAVRSANELELAVEDDGPGIPADARAHLFQPFTSSKGAQGLGMGLYMARLIVESHHGRIDVVDGRLGGARFVVVLPAGDGIVATHTENSNGRG
jgi:signal transduction histidine kinase